MFRTEDMKKHRLHAIYDDDLLHFLESLGLKNAIESGDVRCHFCNDIVSLDTLQAVFPIGNHIGVSCLKQECIKRLEPEAQRG